jgi:hypothetical protein
MLSVKSYAQDPIFTQYFLIPETQNPSFTGFLESTSAGVFHRSQWVSLNLKVDTDSSICYSLGDLGHKLESLFSDATKNYIYTNYIAATIIALFELDRNAIYIPDSKDIDNQYNIRKIQKILKKNNELELLFVNRDAYLNIDKINILKVPIYFKRSRVLYNILHLINNEYDFIEIFQKILKSSQLFIFSIRISLYKTLKSSDKTPENKKEQELFNQRKDLLNRFRTKLLNKKKTLKFKEYIKKSKSAEIEDVKDDSA